MRRVQTFIFALSIQTVSLLVNLSFVLTVSAPSPFWLHYGCGSTLDDETARYLAKALPAPQPTAQAVKAALTRVRASQQELDLDNRISQTLLQLGVWWRPEGWNSSWAPAEYAPTALRKGRELKERGAIGGSVTLSLTIVLEDVWCQCITGFRFFRVFSIFRDFTRNIVNFYVLRVCLVFNGMNGCEDRITRRRSLRVKICITIHPYTTIVRRKILKRLYPIADKVSTIFQWVLREDLF